MKMDETAYKDLFAELERYERKGIDISLDGCVIMSWDVKET